MEHAHLVAPNVAAPHHQHFFNFRLDLDVDGQANDAFEMNTTAGAPGPENPGNVIDMKETPLDKEKMAQRDMSMAQARKWRIGATGQQDALGYEPSYVLVPGGNSIPYLQPNAPVRKRAPFIEHHFFVTKYKEGERYAAGWYPNQSTGGQGLDLYSSDDEALTGQDLVVWYTMGLTHVPRPEEWPVMASHHIGFELLPVGFFIKNPGLDVPRNPGKK
jgi:primary-amine oxidase